MLVSSENFVHTSAAGQHSLLRMLFCLLSWAKIKNEVTHFFNMNMLTAINLLPGITVEQTIVNV